MKIGFLFIALFAVLGLKAQTVKIAKDTADIPSNIHFIRVDGKIFEIKRETSFQEVLPLRLQTIWNGGSTITLGTSQLYPGTIQFYNGTTPLSGIITPSENVITKYQ